MSSSIGETLAFEILNFSERDFGIKKNLAGPVLAGLLAGAVVTGGATAHSAEGITKPNIKSPTSIELVEDSKVAKDTKSEKSGKKSASSKILDLVEAYNTTVNPFPKK